MPPTPALDQAPASASEHTAGEVPFLDAISMLIDNANPDCPSCRRVLVAIDLTIAVFEAEPTKEGV